MKRVDILRKLQEAGLIVREGGKHTLIYNAGGKRVSALGRHKELHNDQVRSIEKQTGVKLLP